MGRLKSVHIGQHAVVEKQSFENKSLKEEQKETLELKLEKTMI